MIGINAGYNRFVAVTTSDANDLAPFNGKDRKLTDAIYVGGAGNVVGVMEDGSTATFTGVQAGTLLPIQVRRINATLTTATNLMAFYHM